MPARKKSTRSNAGKNAAADGQAKSAAAKAASSPSVDKTTSEGAEPGPKLQEHATGVTAVKGASEQAADRNAAMIFGPRGDEGEDDIVDSEKGLTRAAVAMQKIDADAAKGEPGKQPLVADSGLNPSDRIGKVDEVAQRAMLKEVAKKSPAAKAKFPKVELKKTREEQGQESNPAVPKLPGEK